jgi:hypothetical protein
MQAAQRGGPHPSWPLPGPSLASIISHSTHEHLEKYHCNRRKVFHCTRTILLALFIVPTGWFPESFTNLEDLGRLCSPNHQTKPPPVFGPITYQSSRRHVCFSDATVATAATTTTPATATASTTYGYPSYLLAIHCFWPMPEPSSGVR